MKVLVTGVKGQLGHEVAKRLESLHITCAGADMEDFDITNAEETMRAVADCRPDAVIHCAAYTAVDKAESDRENCYRANVQGAKNMAAACTAAGAKLLYISTDYVFGGSGERPFETYDALEPVNYYGRTKFEGEEAVSEMERAFIVRISWLFGKNGGNFVRTMLRLGAAQNEVKVVSDQIGSPTYAYDLARLLCDMIQTEKYGVYHATNEGFCSWYEFAEYIFSCAGMDTRVIPIESKDYISAAKRPKNSRLSKASLDEAGFTRLPHWKDATERFLKELS
jgi:dTDP-4-dehydrorhamnose reductase